MKQNYSIFGELFKYPENLVNYKLDELKGIIANNYPEYLNLISSFLEFKNNKTLDEQREYYIKTFDVQASCYLDIGYILFGEDYKRGEFLVNLANEHKKAENDCGTELSDHLPNLLNLIDKTEDRIFAEELVYCLMIPALREMIKTFVDKGNIYKVTLELLLLVLENDFGGLKYEQFKITPNTKDCFIKKGNKNSQMCGRGIA